MDVGHQWCILCLGSSASNCTWDNVRFIFRNDTWSPSLSDCSWYIICFKEKDYNASCDMKCKACAQIVLEIMLVRLLFVAKAIKKIQYFSITASRRGEKKIIKYKYKVCGHPSQLSPGVWQA